MNDKELEWTRKLLKDEASYYEVYDALGNSSFEYVQDLIDEYINEHGYPITAEQMAESLRIMKEDYDRFMDGERAKRAKSSFNASFTVPYYPIFPGVSHQWRAVS